MSISTIGILLIITIILFIKKESQMVFKEDIVNEFTGRKIRA